MQRREFVTVAGGVLLAGRSGGRRSGGQRTPRRRTARPSDGPAGTHPRPSRLTRRIARAQASSRRASGTFSIATPGATTAISSVTTRARASALIALIVPALGDPAIGARRSRWTASGACSDSGRPELGRKREPL